MEDLTVSEDNDHLGTSVRGGQEPSQGDGKIQDKG